MDVIGDAHSDRYEKALSAVIKDEGVDGALVILTPQSMTNALGTAEAIVRVARRSPKPILCCFMGVVDVSAGVKYLQEHGYPVYKFPEDAAKALGALYRYAHWLNREHLPPFKLQDDRAEGGGADPGLYRRREDPSGRGGRPGTPEMLRVQHAADEACKG